MKLSYIEERKWRGKGMGENSVSLYFDGSFNTFCCLYVVNK